MGGYAFNTGGNSPLMLDPMAEMQQASAQAKQSKLAKLLGTAANAGAGADYSQANMIDPAATQAFQKNQSGLQDDRFKSFAQKASMAAAAWKAGNQPLAQGIYASLVPEAHAIAPGFDLPPQMDDSAAQAFEQLSQGAGGMVQSTFVDAQGNRVGIMRDGRTQVLGQNAPNNQIIDTGNGFFGVNKGNLTAAPVMTGGAQPQQPPPVERGSNGQPVTIDPNLPPSVQAAIRNQTGDFQQGATVQTNSPTYVDQSGAPMAPQGQPMGQQLRSAPKPAAAPSVPSGYRVSPSGGLEPIPGGPAEIAIAARKDAADAKAAAQAAAADQKSQAAKARQAAAAQASDQLVSSIDDLMKSPGFGKLGTVMGDMEISTPYIRSDAKDASEQLHNIAGQVALATMSRLKALSAQGATGFGSLSGPELHLLQNSIAALSADKISNAQLKTSLSIIRNTMAKVSGWNPSQQQSAPAQGGWSATRVK